MHLGQLLAVVEYAKRPVLSDDMVLLMKAGKQVPWEPAIFAELASTGRWDERQITDMIVAHDFAFVITTGHPGMPIYDSRYDPAVSRAIEAAYPYSQKCGGRIVHRPSDLPAPATASGCEFWTRRYRTSVKKGCGIVPRPSRRSRPSRLPGRFAALTAAARSGRLTASGREAFQVVAAAAAGAIFQEPRAFALHPAVWQ
jgi:hypothetical protein